MIVVSDTSPVRALAHLDQLDLLRRLFEQVLIPPAVADELERPKSKLAPVPLESYDSSHLKSHHLLIRGQP